MIPHNKSFASYDGKTKNNKLKLDCYLININNDNPETIYINSGKKYWFKCDVCNHDIQMIISNIVKRNSWCSYCAGQKICQKECDKCISKSFASYTEKTKKENLKINCWHENNKIKPYQIRIKTSKKYLFKCDKCNHNFESAPSHIVSLNTWCPYCANLKLCNDNECKFCYENSLASYKEKTKKGNLKINCWNIEKNNGLIPRNIAKNARKKYYFTCDICNHDFEKAIYTLKTLTWCIYCGHQQLCNDENCIICFNNSFASYDKKTINDKLKISCLINKKNDNILPRNMAKCSGKKYWFECDICSKQFEQSLDHITMRHSWCPYCKNKTENMFIKWFKNNYNYDLLFQKKYDWCINHNTNRHMFYDFVIETLKIIIEIDGEQHFTQVLNWNSPEETFERDMLKIKYALKYKFTIIRILQEDIWFDKNDWKNKFDKLLKKHKKPQLFCVGDELKYSKYLKITNK
jgi:hypothetical protein